MSASIVPEPTSFVAHSNRAEPGWLMSAEDELTLTFRLARAAQSRWAKVPVRARAERLSVIAELLLRDKTKWVDVIRDDNGKAPVEALGHEVGASVSGVRWLCEQGWHALEPQSVATPWLPHRAATVERVPFGVVVVISPWNFPLSIPLGQVVASLLAGNAVILKPSEVTPKVGAAIADLLDECDLPPNLVRVVHGDGSVGAKLIDLRPDKVLFTGSVATGRKVMAAAARHPIAVSLELGGVDALIVLEDADLDLASSAAVWGGFMNGGQVCASVERVLVARSVRDAFVARLLDKAASLDPSTDLGPYTADKQRAVYERHLQDARQRGLEVVGGDWVGDRTLAPTVVTGEGIEDAEVYRDETFGPLIAVRTFRDDQDAARQHNALWGGLTASVFSTDSSRARRVANELDAGLVSINDVAATLHAAAELPWGGMGASGFGRSHGVEGLLELTQTKVIDSPRSDRLGFKRPWWFPYDPDQVDLMDAYVDVVGERRLRKRVSAAGRLAKAALRSMARAPRL